MEVAMELADQADHIALLALMLVGVLTRRLMEIGLLDRTRRTRATGWSRMSASVQGAAG